MPSRDAGDELARRLRWLRESLWPDLALTQSQLARGISAGKSVSPPLISAWEKGHKIPPANRLAAYARFFATRRSMDNHLRPRLLADSELKAVEEARLKELQAELMNLRNAALEDPVVLDRTADIDAPRGQPIGGGVWHYPDQRPVTIVCAKLSKPILSRIPYTDPRDPNYVEKFAFGDVDALIELHGHIRAVNPLNQVNIRLVSQLAADDLASHLVLLGGVDFNNLTRDLQKLLRLPVRQISNSANDDTWEAWYEVDDGGGPVRQYRPLLEDGEGPPELVEDIGVLVRAPNPFNRERTVTMCHALYARGTYGVVRALTDANFRDRNEGFLETTFGSADTYGVLMRVNLSQGTVITPDWTHVDTALYTWTGTRV